MRHKVKATHLVIALALTTTAWAADNTPPCLSKAQARAEHPKAHLYWHGSDHCWDNQQRRHRDPPDARKALAQEPKHTSNPLPPSDRKRIAEIIYPPLVAQQATIINKELFTAWRPITEWPLLLDIDATGPDPDNGIDGCCWPPLESLQ
jgi:hypothetical protein